MSFLTPLVVEEEKDSTGGANAQWKLTAPLVFHSEEQGIAITVPAGFVTDFCSVPRVPLAFLLFGDLGNEAGTVHDYLYSKLPDGTHLLPKDASDLILKEALKDLGVDAMRRDLIWAGVHLFGQKFYDEGGGAAEAV